MITPISAADRKSSLQAADDHGDPLDSPSEDAGEHSPVRAHRCPVRRRGLRAREIRHEARDLGRIEEPFEQGILQALDLAPGRTLRLSVIAAYASCTLSRLSRAITRLEGRGWVRREVDPDDGRFTLGILTPAGHDKVASSTPGHQELVRRLVFDTLTEAQARRLGAMSRRIATAVGPGEPWSPATS